MLPLIKSVPTLDLLLQLNIFNCNFLTLTISWVQGYHLTSDSFIMHSSLTAVLFFS